MYQENAMKQQEIDKLSFQIENLNKVKEYGPELIKEFEEKMKRYPERTEEFQYKINQIQILLMNYEKQVKPLTAKLVSLL